VIDDVIDWSLQNKILGCATASGFRFRGSKGRLSALKRLHIAHNVTEAV